MRCIVASLEKPNEMETRLISLQDDGTFPNSRLPVVLYKNGAEDQDDLARFFKRLFKKNNWYNSWKAGIFPYHHYHSITHEVMGVCSGSTVLQLGGESGKQMKIETGDVLIIPAGVAHKNLKEENAVACIGAYPDGRDYDMNYGKAGERPEADKRIALVPLPDGDPLLGAEAGIVKAWRKDV